jgi:hypothetical protein
MTILRNKPFIAPETHLKLWFGIRLKWKQTDCAKDERMPGKERGEGRDSYHVLCPMPNLIDNYAASRLAL